MKIAILHRINDPYTLNRIKVFLEEGHNVISIVFPDKGQLPVHQNWKVVRLSNSVLYSIPFAKRLIYLGEIQKILNHYRPSIFFLIGAFNLFYAKIKIENMIKVVENQGSDVLLNPKKFIFYKLFYKKYYPEVKGVIQDSEISRSHGIRYGATSDLQYNRVFQIGIDVRIFNTGVPKGQVRERYNLSDRPIILHTRSLRPLYNVDILVESIKYVREIIPGIMLILTGNKEDLPKKIIRFIIENHLEKNILFVGFQDHDNQLNCFYSDADVVVSIPSSDSSPFSVYESMAMKRPVIATDLLWIESVFKKERHLLTIPVRNVHALAEKIINVIGNKVEVDLEGAFEIISTRINMQTANIELIHFFNFLMIHFLGIKKSEL